MVVTLGANRQDKRNKQILEISAKNLEKRSPSKRFDSTLEERDRNYSTSSREPRLTEYR